MSKQIGYTKRDAGWWLVVHTDYWHDGDRSSCQHCQEMIRAFGPMPSIDELDQAYRVWRSAQPKKCKSLSATARLAIFARDDYACVECGSRNDLTVDHSVPVVQGGGDDEENLRTLCRSCNSRKGGR